MNSKETLVLIEQNNQIILKKEADVAVRILEDSEEKNFWKKLSHESLKRAWTEEDDIWDKIAEKDLK